MQHNKDICKFDILAVKGLHTSTKLNGFVYRRSRVKFHKLPLLTRDVTGRHYRPVLSDVSLPRLSERRRRLKFRLNNQGSFWICARRKLGQENQLIIVTSSFSKSSVFKMVSATLKCQAGVFKFLRFEERFRKAPFS